MARIPHTIPCTHTGSLPRPDDLIKTMWAVGQQPLRLQGVGCAYRAKKIGRAHV